MADDVKPEIIKKTQNALNKYIKKPPLSDKLLKKPPFRFLHDIVTSVIRETGFLKDVFTPEELNPDNVKDRESKVKFLTKLISAVKGASGNSISAKPGKIVAGLEVGKTLELLQAIAKGINNQQKNGIKAKTTNEQIDKRKSSTESVDNNKEESKKTKGKSKESLVKEGSESKNEVKKEAVKENGRVKEKRKIRKGDKDGGSRESLPGAGPTEELHSGAVSGESDVAATSAPLSTHSVNGELHNADTRIRREDSSEIRTKNDVNVNPKEDGTEENGLGGRDKDKELEEDRTGEEAGRRPSTRRSSSRSRHPHRGNESLQKKEENEAVENRQNGHMEEGLDAMRRGSESSNEIARSVGKIPSTKVEEEEGTPLETKSEEAVVKTKNGEDEDRKAPRIRRSASITRHHRKETERQQRREGKEVVEVTRKKDELKETGRGENSMSVNTEYEEEGSLKMKKESKSEEAVAKMKNGEEVDRRPQHIRRTASSARLPRKETEGSKDRKSGGDKVELPSEDLTRISKESNKENDPSLDKEVESRAGRRDGGDQRRSSVTSRRSSSKSKHPQKVQNEKGDGDHVDKTKSQDKEKDKRNQTEKEAALVLGAGELEKRLHSSKVERPRTARRPPPSARPPSSRPGAPRARDRGTVEPPKEAAGTGEVKEVPVITEADQKIAQEEDQDEEMVRVEGAEPEGAIPQGLEEAGTEELPGGGGPTGEGALVAQILLSKRELEDKLKQEVAFLNTPSVDIEWAKTGGSEKRAVYQKEAERLRMLVQGVTRTAGPLGKLLDFLQEDVDLAVKEMSSWRESTASHTTQLQAEEKLTEESLSRYRGKLVELEGLVEQEHEAIRIVKANILTNDKKIQSLLSRTSAVH